MGSIPAMDEDRERLLQIDGAMPRLNAIPPAARSTRAARARSSRCRVERPDLMAAGSTRAACWLHAPTLQAAGVSAALVEVEGLAKTFDVSPPWLNRVAERKPRQFVHAVDDVSFTIARGKTLALVGESGCGKSTVARLLVGLYAPTRGSVVFDGVDRRRRRRSGRRRSARRMQMIFQDPYASLNPRWKVRDIVAEPLREHGFAAARARAREQRIAIASASCCARSASRPPTPRSSRTSSRAASGSASRSRARSRPSPSSWSATSRPRRSTSRCRRRSSTS